MNRAEHHAVGWPLTPREFETARLVAEGLENAEIADQLHVTLNSAKTYVRVAMGKLLVRNRVELTLWYLEAVGRLLPVPAPPAVPAPRREEDLCLATRS